MTSTNSTMKAMALEFKSENAHLVELPKPSPECNQVLVKVQLSALDTGAPDVVDKTFSAMFLNTKTKPLVLGWHYYGVVESVGSNVSTIKPNDTVFGFLQYEPSQNQGAFAEFIVVKEKDCAKAPEGVSKEVVAASSTEALTALQAMRDCGGLTANKHVLIVGAGGGVGSAAVGIAKRLGAEVTAIVSTKDVERVQKLGANKVIDRKKVKDPLSEIGALYDVIFDAAVAYSLLEAAKYLEKNGTYVATLPTWSMLVGLLLSPLTGKRVKFVTGAVNLAPSPLRCLYHEK